MAEDGVAAGRRIAKMFGGEDFSPAPAARLGTDRRSALAVGAVAVVLIGVIGVLAFRPGPGVEPVGPAVASSVPVASVPALATVPSSSPAAPAAPAAGATISVYVVGQVRRPGVVTVSSGARVVDAVTAAGGVTRGADPAAVNLARKVADGEQILVPKPGQAVPAAPGESPAPGASGAVAGPVNLNTATEAELDSLPGVGPVIAGKIVAWRTENGRFATVDDLNQVSGIGEATMARLRPLVTV